jgi:ABC-type branched-subunit amino acid transport system substrate-binding protein
MNAGGPGRARPFLVRVPLGARFARGIALAALALAACAGSPKRNAPGPATDGESLVRQPVSAERTRAIAAWARSADLDALLRLLRYDSAQLGPDEKPIAEAALQRTPAARADLHRRLEARRDLVDARAGRKGARNVADIEALRPHQSIWRIGVLLPDRGDYAGYAASVLAALEAGLAYGHGAAGPFTLEFHGTGDAEPARAAAALDTAAATCGVIVGELLSEPTFALAAGTRIAGLPLVSPTATDEAIGSAGPAVFQVGPANAQRGAELVRALLADKPRKVAILTSSGAAKGPLVGSFAAAAESLGATIVRRDTYAPGTTDFRTLARAIRTFGAEVLFWDGDTREAVLLLRQLGADGISVRVCGGTALAPEQFHAGEKVLIEGVTYVADDWRLAPAQQSVVDSLAQSRGEHAGALWTRGFLAGRRIADAVAAGARTPSELAARLRHRDANLRAAGFLDCTQDSATIPVWTVQRGKPVELPAAEK